MTNDKTTLAAIEETLEFIDYTLERSICFKPPQSGQREIELKALELNKQALAMCKKLREEYKISVTFDDDSAILRKFMEE